MTLWALIDRRGVCGVQTDRALQCFYQLLHPLLSLCALDSKIIIIRQQLILYTHHDG
jgi:hypothetical protein